MSSTADVTGLLKRAAQGETGAREELYPLIERELHRLAGAQLSKESPGHSLRATELLDEVFVKLINIRDISWNDRGHFFAIAAKAMRRTIISYWRKKRSPKRGGDLERIDLDDANPMALERAGTLLELDEALTRLESAHPRAYRAVELHFFAGLNFEEIAKMFDRDRRTILRDWSLAKAWLYKELAKK
jgi:RNA polymerase sigma factor (TIGR02999 family)